MTAAQMSLMDLMRAPPQLRPVDPDGPVIQGEPHETLRLPHPRLAWDMARIELHRHTDRLWMWSAGDAGGGYRVGPKWGRFAATRDDALHYAARELIARMERMIARPHGYAITPAQMRQTIAWAEGLT